MLYLILLMIYKKNNKYNKSIIIDFYGPIEKKDNVYFEDNISKYNFIFYKGIVEPANIHATLGNYDLLLLPTRHEGEGFPGTILDAYISGVPVIVSEWKFLPEFVEQGKTGYVYKLGDNQSFYNKIVELYNNPTNLLKLKKNAHHKSFEYSENKAWSIIKNHLT